MPVSFFYFMGTLVAKKGWVKNVTEHSHAMDLEKGVFTKDNPTEIAKSLKRSVERSERTKGTKFQSAMSMLNFHINRSGDNLSEEQKEVLEKTKDELRRIFHKGR